VTKASNKQAPRKIFRRIIKSILECVLPWGERLARFRTARGDYLPNRLRILFGTYEAEERQLMSSFLRPGQTIVDAGANVGYLTLFFARSTGANGEVYAFEPNPIVFPLLARNGASFPQIKAMNRGLSFESVESTLFLAGSDHSVGSFSAKYPASHVFYQETGELRTAQVHLVHGDQFLTEQGVNKIDILKIDVEGWELNVLRGLEKTIAQSPCITIFCEYNRAAQECAGREPLELPNWFFERGFMLSAPRNGALEELSQRMIGQWIEQLPATGYSTLFASRG